MAWNNAFFRVMRARLPRELRDMVYTHLAIDGKTRDYTTYLFQETKGWCTEACLSADNFTCLTWHYSPLFFRPAVVGSEVALEMVEAWYKAMQSNPDHPFITRSPRRVECFVLEDHFGVVVTGSDLLQNMTLEFDIEKLVLSHDMSYADPTAARHCLDSLHRIKNKRGFRSRVELSQRRVRLNLWPLVFDLLRPILREFVDAGAYVSLSWE
jgi:hypothetical protein